MTGRYRVHMSSDAQRVVRTELPQDVSMGVFALAQRTLAVDPRSCGEPLPGIYDGLWAIERSEYVLHYEIDETDRAVRIVMIGPLPGSRLV